MKKIVLFIVFFGLITSSASATYYKADTFNCDDIAMLEDLDRAVATHRAVITELNCERRVAPKPQPKPVYKPKKVVKPIVKPVKPVVKPVVVEQPVVVEPVVVEQPVIVKPIVVKPVIVKPAPRPVIHRVVKYVPTITVVSVSEKSHDCCDSCDYYDCDCGC